MDDLRNHDPQPNAHEREWIATDPVPAVMRVTVFAAIALMIGAAASTLVTSSSVAASPASKVASSR